MEEYEFSTDFSEEFASWVNMDQGSTGDLIILVKLENKPEDDSE